MKFCPECGSQLQIETAKFCPNCGLNLASITSSPSQSRASRPSSSVEPKQQTNSTQPETITITTEGDENIVEEKPMSIHQLGINLEDMTEKIHQSMGYATQRRQRLADSDDVKHEIDVYATRGSRVRAIECKNYDPSRNVGIKELRDFHTKVTSLRIKDALFVTNTTYSSESEKFALSRAINLWDGDDLKERFFSMTLGRLGSGQQTLLELALPINVLFAEINRIDVVNPELIKIQARLVLHPYYKFEWKIDITRFDPARGKHRLMVNNIHIVDALDGEIINPKQNIISSLVSGLFKKSDEKLAMREEKQIVEDLINMKPETKYKVTQTSDYAVSQLRPTVKSQTVQKSVIQQAIDETRKEESYKVKSKYGDDTKNILLMAKPSEVIIKKASLIYVPKWDIDIESGQVTFMRKMLAASGITIIDTVAHCPKHFSIGDKQLVKKQTHAICEICGRAFCKEHIFQADGKYYCEEHNPNKPVTNTQASQQEQNSAGDQAKETEDAVKKTIGGWKSFFK